MMSSPAPKKMEKPNDDGNFPFQVNQSAGDEKW